MPSPRSMARTPAIHPHQLRWATNTVIKDSLSERSISHLLLHRCFFGPNQGPLRHDWADHFQ